MNPDEYIKRRLVHQIDWYDRKSQSAQAAYKNLRRVEIIFAAAIPFFAGFADNYWIGLLVGLLGAIVVIMASFQSLGVCAAGKITS